jgi:hypothetical protein
VPQRAGAWTKSQVEATGDEVLFPVKAEVAGSSPVRTARQDRQHCPKSEA